ncbi:MAG: cytochrome C oxidase Cbb3 [Bacteroidota bacterium]
MFKHYFEQIHNVEVWPIISLSIFFIFFISLIVWVVRTDKNYIKIMSNLPMEDGAKSFEEPKNSAS